MNLTNAKILITRPRRQADSFAIALHAAGAKPIFFPVIEIGPMEDTAPLDRALTRLACYEWLVLTSVNGVEVVWKRLAALGLLGIPTGVRVAAIGPKTSAALQVRGVKPDFVPDEYVAEAILPGLGCLDGRWVLLPRADIARPALAQAIQAVGGIAHEIAVYRTLPANPDPAGLAALRSGVDVVTFTSSSTVRSFISLAPAAGLNPFHLAGYPTFAWIGPVTSATAVEEGLPVAIVAETYTTEGLFKALLDFKEKSTIRLEHDGNAHD